MAKFVRVDMPTDQPEDTLKLCNRIIVKDTAEGVNSSLAGVIDMTAFGILVTSANNKRNSATLKDEDAVTKYELAAGKAGLGKGQTKDWPGTLYWYVVQVRDILLVVHKSNEEALSQYGFHVVVTQTGARRNVRIDSPVLPNTMVELAKAIIARHTFLGGSSPLTAALVDMTAFGTLVTDTDTLLTDWAVLRGEVQALNNEALNIMGYGAGQTISTAGTIYYELGKIRTRLLQKFQGTEEVLSNWGFKVVESESTPGRKKGPSGFSITGTIADNISGAPISDAVVIVQTPEVIALTDAHGKYFMPAMAAGSYTMFVHKDGYINQNMGSVAVTAGAVTTVNVQMVVGSGSGLGKVAGQVMQAGAGASATVGVQGTGISVNTDPAGNYILNDVPAGSQVIEAFLTSNPATTQPLNTTVVSDATVIVNFNFA